jgi:hypothetical protein
MGFEKFVKTKVGENQYNEIRGKYKKRMMLDFDVQVKRNFSGRDEKKRAVELRDVKSNPKEGVIDENITLSA